VTWEKQNNRINQPAALDRMTISAKRRAKKAAMILNPTIRDSFSSKPSINNAIDDKKRPVSAVQIKMFAPGQCRLLNTNANKEKISVSEVMMILSFSILPESFGRIPAGMAMKSKMPVAVPQVTRTFAPGQCIVLKSRPKSNITNVMTEVILMVLIMADNELVSNR
jgi:hypothetical protein